MPEDVREIRFGNRRRFVDHENLLAARKPHVGARPPLHDEAPALQLGDEIPTVHTVMNGRPVSRVIPPGEYEGLP
jgi:hypothetical protein